MIIGIIGQGVTDLFADILYSGEEDNVLGDDETEEEVVDEGWEREGKLEKRLRGLGESQWGDEAEWGGRGEARGTGRDRLPRSESSSPHKLHPARCVIFCHFNCTVHRTVEELRLISFGQG